MNKTQAIDLIKQHITKPNLIKHMLAVAAIMKAMAREIDEDENKWELIGLLHDIDFEKTQEMPAKHTLEAEVILQQAGFDAEFIKSIKTHNYEHTKIIPETKMEKALLVADNVSGIVIAGALIIPSKKLADLSLATLMNKYKDKSFARQCDRNKMQVCKHIGISLEKLIEISLKALQNISNDLGL